MPASSAMTAPRITNHRAGSARPFPGNPRPPIMAVTIGENTSTATIAAASVRSGGRRTPMARAASQDSRNPIGAIAARAAGCHRWSRGRARADIAAACGTTGAGDGAAGAAEASSMTSAVMTATASCTWLQASAYQSR